MDELKEKKNILLKSKDYIMRMANNKKKVDMMQAYYSLLQYYHDILGDDNLYEELNIDDEFNGKYYRYLYLETKRSIINIEENAPVLLNKYEQIINAYKKNDFCKYEHIGLIKVDKSKMERIMCDFFSTLSDDVLSIYYNMIMGHNIFLNNSVMDRLGYAMNTIPLDNSCITIQNITQYLDFYITLAHEIGHCYQFYLQKSQKKYSSLDPYCEITSILFEKLFIIYLKNNNIIKNNLVLELEDHITFLNNVSISKVLCELLIDKKISFVNPYNLSYSCNVNMDEIKKEIIDNCGYVPPINFNMELTEFHYSIGNIISMYYINKLKNNFDIEWKNYKDFICTVNYLTMDEVINKYFDINLIEENIKELTKSYCKK